MKSITLLRKVSKSGNRYQIIIPKEIGPILHHKKVLVTIEVLEK